MENGQVQGLDFVENPDSRDNVDTSRPFRSVKEAVAIFGERFLVGDIYSPKPFALPKKEAPFFSPSPAWKVNKIEQSWKDWSANPHRVYEKFIDSNELTLSDSVKKLEQELEKTKAELKLLKERESETEVALATLNAKLHKNMSKLTHDEAYVAGKAMTSFDDRALVIWEEEKKRDDFLKRESRNSTSLAEILSMGDLLVGRKKDKKVKKKKPIIPLVGGFFSRKKTPLHNPLYKWN